MIGITKHQTSRIYLWINRDSSNAFNIFLIQKSLLYVNLLFKQKLKIDHIYIYILNRNADLAQPSSQHVVVTLEGLAVTQKSKVHRSADEFTVERQVHAAHGVQRPLGNRDHRIHVPDMKSQRI